MEKRILSVYVTLVIFFLWIITRVYFVSTGETLAKAADMQSRYIVSLDETRGYIYDINLRPMVNTASSYKAVVEPSPEAATTILSEIAQKDRDKIIKKLEDRFPFVLNIDNSEIYSQGVTVFETIKRYSENTLAPHIIGHLGSENQGVMGVELSYNDYLKSHSGNLEVSYIINAYGDRLPGAVPETSNINYNDKHGVVLTIDEDIQRICENAMTNTVQKGSAIVMDVKTGDIKATVSVPDFDPNNISLDLDNPDKPFFNRAFSPTSVGSTFKLVAVAAALEKGYNVNRSYKCEGFIEVAGTKYGCHNLNGHGAINMQTAVEVSCNPYFVMLARDVGEQNIAYKAAQIGFGRSYEIMPMIYTPSGVLPTFKQLENVGQATNFSFGQGLLTASPLQVAQMISTVANGGTAVTPRIIEGFSNDGTAIDEHTEKAVQTQVIEPRAAKEVARLMISVVESGSGKKAKPYVGGAGGKTASAQTGVYVGDKEVVHAWFAGFYPASGPKYAIVVMAEGEESGGDVCAPIFKEICDRINFLTSDTNTNKEK